MKKEQNKKNMTVGDSIFDEAKKNKNSAQKVLELAKQQEKEKLKSGQFHYAPSQTRSFTLTRK